MPVGAVATDRTDLTAVLDETRERAGSDGELLDPRGDAGAGLVKDLVSFRRGTPGGAKRVTWIARPGGQAAAGGPRLKSAVNPTRA